MKKTMVKVIIGVVGLSIVLIADTTTIANFVIGAFSGVGICLVDEYMN